MIGLGKELVMSEYCARIAWRNDVGVDFAKNRYTRGHEWEFDEGVKVPASSSPHSVRLPYSVEAAVDPEEALVAAAASCHMLTFLYLAAKEDLRVESYRDEAVGEMTANADGTQWISKIKLSPKIEWGGETLPTGEEIDMLHHKAHKECYIANSIKAEIIVKS